jgi:hypothetical protein
VRKSSSFDIIKTTDPAYLSDFISRAWHNVEGPAPAKGMSSKVMASGTPTAAPNIRTYPNLSNFRNFRIVAAYEGRTTGAPLTLAFPPSIDTHESK